jgi:hypothetical protein
MGNSSDASRDRKVVPIRSEAPASAVMPVARKASGAGSCRRVTARRRAFKELTEAAARAYDAAAAHRLGGDEVGAALLVSAAWKALAQAATIGEEIAAL